MIRADLTSEQVPAPAGRWCSSGHIAAEHWAKEGPGTPLVATLFYQISSRDNTSVNGMYCEMCLIVANAMAAKKKMEIRNGSTK